MKKGFSIFLLYTILVCGSLFAQTNEDKHLKVLLRNGLESHLPLMGYPGITFFEDSIKIASKVSYAIARRADIRTITFVTDIDTCIVHREVKEGRYYRIKGLTGNYIDASGTGNNENLSLASIDDGNIKSTVFYFDNGCFLSYTNGTYIDEGGKLGNIGQAGSKYTVAVSQNFSDKFMIQGTNSTLLSDNGSEKVCTSTGKGSFNELFTIEEVAELPITITAAKYATLYAPVALEIAEGVTAYTVTIKENWVELNEITDEIIPAYTGVVLYSESPDTYYFPITATENVLESDLRGSIPTTYYTEPGTYYALAIVDGKVGFYKDKLMNSRFQNNSHKAFIYVPLTSNIAHYSFRFDDETTSIVDVGAENKNTGIYDIQGRKINNIVMPGVYIVNGEKVLVK